MAISNSYAKLPEGNFIVYTSIFEHQHWLAIHANNHDGFSMGKHQSHGPAIISNPVWCYVNGVAIDLFDEHITWAMAHSK